MEEVYKLIEIARNCRSIAATNMNERSSRSHMIFILTISQNNTLDLTAKTGKLYLVDLAGSEKISKTGAEGKTLDEAKKINASLTTLGKVINALTDGKSTHIPYRDSKLTRVLQESLGGNSKTTLIVTCSPHPNNLPETISTLRFGISAKKIKNTPKINKELTVAELQALLDKSEKELEVRSKYIEQLKNHILVDLKQKSVPDFETDKNIVPIEENDNDYLTELQRQL
jgi:kinesin family member 5